MGELSFLISDIKYSYLNGDSSLSDVVESYLLDNDTISILNSNNIKDHKTFLINELKKVV